MIQTDFKVLRIDHTNITIAVLQQRLNRDGIFPLKIVINIPLGCSWILSDFF
jgi:hypothetical protein